MNQAHSLMIKTNHFLIKGGELTDAHKRTITTRLLAAKSTPEQARRRFSKIRGNERDMYPSEYVLPYNSGEKLVTILNQMPKTQILSMNNYELEILRLLNLFAPTDPSIANMTSNTLDRLKRTCFGGKGCSTGECYDAGLVTLRFLSTVAPDNTNWIKKQIHTFNVNVDKRMKSKYYGRDYRNFYTWYYWLCLSEMPDKLAIPEIVKQKEQIELVAKQEMPERTETDKIISPVKKAILQNCITRVS